MNHKLYTYIEYIVITLIFILSSITTYYLFSNSINIVNNNLILVEKEILIEKDIIINDNDINYLLSQSISDIIPNENNNTIDNIKMEKLIESIKNNREIKNEIIKENYFLDIYKMGYKNQNFLISNDNKSYEFGFISKEIKDNIMYLYSHNNYKFTENSGYYLYNNLDIGSIIYFNDNLSYEVISTNIINYDDPNQNKNIPIITGVDIIYFTCTPDGENIRKLYQLKKI